MGLHCSHFHGRRKVSVRFDEDNAIALCFGCHRHMEENPPEHVTFFQQKLGMIKYDLLTIKANTQVKPDLELIKIWLKSELQKIEGPILGKH